MRRNKTDLASELVSSARRQAEPTRYHAPADGVEDARPEPVPAPEPPTPGEATPPDTTGAKPMSSAYGFPIPRDAVEAERLVQLAVRIPESLRWAIRMACLMQGVEIQEFAREAFEDKLRTLAANGNG